MTIISRETWGPALWTILHTMAQKSGTIENPIITEDEAHAWTGVFKTLHNIMPCQKCSQHFRQYVNKKQISSLFIAKGYRRKDWLQEFFWELHNEVNGENQKEIFAKEGLEKYENSPEFRDAWDLIKKMTTTGVAQNQLKLLDVKASMRFLETIKRLYGL